MIAMPPLDETRSGKGLGSSEASQHSKYYWNWTIKFIQITRVQSHNFAADGLANVLKMHRLAFDETANANYRIVSPLGPHFL